MKGLNLKFDLHNAPFDAFRLAMAVSFNGVHVMTWVQTAASQTGTPKFEAIAQFKPEDMRVYGCDHKWVPQFVGEVESSALEVALADIPAVTEEAVRAMFGNALDFEIRHDEEGVQ